MSSESKPLGSEAAKIRFSNGTTLEGVGGTGTVRQRRPEAGRLRSAALPSELDTSPALDRALDELGIREQETIDLDATEIRAQAGDTVTLTPATDGDTAPRVVLYQDESGGISWHFAPRAARPKRPGLRTRGAPRFVIALRDRASRATLKVGMPRRNLRGPITKLGRKIFKVFVLPVVSALLEDPVRWLGEKVERRYKRNQLWLATPDNYRRPPQAPVVDWSKLKKGPTLLLVHGIFSSVEGMLAGLPRRAMESWHSRYEGRVLAFDHLTVSESPEDNARFVLGAVRDALPNERVTFDILCHSRGGIVSRALAERGAQLVQGSNCSFRSVYFVAAPNAGSPLGDAEHMVDMIDLFTNCLTAFPDGPIVYSLEVLLGLVTLVGHAGARALPGIAALGTRDSYVTDVLNRGTEKSLGLYGAAASDFEPQPGRENGWLIDRLGDPLMDRVFTVAGRHVANDLVVPQRGVFAANGHPSFPIAEPLVYSAADGIWHSAFFAQPRTIAHIDAHFDSVAQTTTAAKPAAALRRRLRGGQKNAALRQARGGLLGAILGPPVSAPRTAQRNSALGRRAGGGVAVKTAPRKWPAPPARGGLRGRGSRASAIYKPPPKRAAPVEETVARDPALDFHERLEAGASDFLLVRLEPAGAGPAPVERMTLTFDPGVDEIELVAELSAPGFAIEGKRHAPLRILRERDPEQERAKFKLTALDPGAKPVERAIVVSFFRGNECVGGITHHTVVVPKGYAEPTIESPERTSPLRVSSRRREPADLIVNVRQPEKGKDVFELSMRSQVPGEEYESRDFGSFDLEGKELSVYLSNALDPSFAKFPGDDVPDDRYDAALADWNAGFLGTLDDLGDQLWIHLPKEFRAEYLRLAALAEPPRSIFVFSDELLFPWEIVRPSGKVNGKYVELPPLGVSHVLGRWRPGTGARPQPQAMSVSSMAIVMPDALASGLPWAEEEVKQLQQLIPFARNITPATLKQVRQLLASGDAQMVHFSGHGEVGANADLTGLELEGGDRITAMAFAVNRLGSTRQPVLYLNACTVGRGGRVLGRAGGFAGNCLESGWSGVVAPYWPVYDPSASAFGVEFYRKLKAGRAIGEALSELRNERRDDPTAQAYAYFGDPFARVLLG